MISIVVPALNEESVIHECLWSIHDFLTSHGLEHEVIVAANGCTDRTVAVVSEVSQEHSWCRGLEIPERAPGKAFALAVKQARGDVIVTLDADLSVGPMFVLKAVEELQSAEMVIGSKSLGRQSRPTSRIIASRTYIRAVQLVLDLPYSDYSNCAKAYRSEFIRSFVNDLGSGTGYVLEAVLAAKNLGLQITEVPVDCTDHRISKFNLPREGIERLWHLLRLRRSRTRA